MCVGKGWGRYPGYPSIHPSLYSDAAPHLSHASAISHFYRAFKSLAFGMRFIPKNKVF